MAPRLLFGARSNFGSCWSILLSVDRRDGQVRSSCRSARLRRVSRMNAQADKVLNALTLTLSSGIGAAQRRSASEFSPRRPTRTALRFAGWRRRSQKWGCLMMAAQRGENQAYEQLLRELDGWLRRYYGRRLPRVAAEDAKQEALLAVHANRHITCPPNRSDRGSPRLRAISGSTTFEMPLGRLPFRSITKCK
jgi:hypothetical protein